MEKKHLFLIIGMLNIAFALYAYNFPPVKDEYKKSSLDLYSSQPSAADDKPSTLSMGLIREMVAQYRQTQLVSIENASKNAVKDDSHSILFDLDTIKKFIADIEKGVKINRPTGNTKLAIRLYYSAYPTKDKWSTPAYKNLSNLLGNDITDLYQRKHTLIFLPVIKNSKGIFADFNPFDINTYEGFKKQSVAGAKAKGTQDDPEIPALNHGQLIPPASTDGEGF